MSIAAIAVLGFIGTGVAYVLAYQIITSEGATVASTVLYLLPVVAIILGVLVLSESVTAVILPGPGRGGAHPPPHISRVSHAWPGP